MLAVRIRSALITASALLAAGAAGAAEDGSAGEGGERSEPPYELAIPAAGDAGGTRLAALYEPLTVRAARRAQARFQGDASGGEDAKNRYRWAGRKVRILKYKQPFELAERDMVFKFRVPGKRGTWMKLELEF